MDHVSRPLQVVLAAAVVFAALWFVALRPKPDAGSGSPAAAAPAAKPSTPTPATPHQPGSSLPGGLDRSVAKANQAKAQANQSAQASEKAVPRTSAPSTLTPSPRVATGARRPTHGADAAGRLLASGALAALPNATTRRAPAPRPAPVRSHPRARGGVSPAAVTSALAHGKVVALLFWNSRGADDRLVRNELRRVSTHGGRVLVAAVPIRSVSRYSAVTRGVQVLQSPTVLIVDRARTARILTGYTDAAEIGQAVTEALTLR